MAIRILKFKYKPEEGDILIRYEQDNDQTKIPDIITLETKDTPKDILVERLNKMAQHVIAICQLPEHLLQSLNIIGVTITHNQSQGLVITALRELSNSNCPMVINTPHFTREGQDKNVYSPLCAQDVDLLVESIIAYINGERAQGQLFNFSDYAGKQEHPKQRVAAKRRENG